MNVRFAISVSAGAVILAVTPALATSSLTPTLAVTPIPIVSAPTPNPTPTPTPSQVPASDRIEVGDVLKYDFDLTRSNSNSSNTYGNVRTFDEKITDQSRGIDFEINLTAAAYTATKVGGSGSTTYSINNAYLGQFSEGLGVTTRNDAGGNGNNHQIDNVGSVDFILLTFDKAVTLNSIDRASYTLYAINGSNQATGNCVNSNCKQDNDASYMATSTTAAQINQALAWANAYPQYLAKPTTDSRDWKPVPAKTGGSINGNTVLAATSTVSNQWAVGGAFNNPDSFKDGFKLRGIEISWQVTAAPEPETWAMMIVGFGFIGAAARRQRRIAAVA